MQVFFFLKQMRKWAYAGARKTGKNHVFGSEQGLKSKGSDPQAGMHDEMILPISEQQLKISK